MRRCIPGALWSAICGSLLIIAIGSVRADSYSALAGRVVDPSDRVVPGAEVVVRNAATLLERTATTNNEGIFEIPALPVGTYRMQISAPGFRLYKVEALT